MYVVFFFFQAEDGIRDLTVTGVQTCALPISAVAAVNTGRSGVWILAQASSDPKCVRCWHRRPDVGSDARHPQLCARCVSNVEGPGEQRRFVSETGGGKATATPMPAGAAQPPPLGPRGWRVLPLAAAAILA